MRSLLWALGGALVGAGGVYFFFVPRCATGYGRACVPTSDPALQQWLLKPITSPAVF